MKIALPVILAAITVAPSEDRTTVVVAGLFAVAGPLIAVWWNNTSQDRREAAKLISDERRASADERREEDRALRDECARLRERCSDLTAEVAGLCALLTAKGISLPYTSHE